jgi:hypothetical protein
MARFDQGHSFDSHVHFDALPPPVPASRKARMAKVKLDIDSSKPQEAFNASTAHIAAMATPEGVALFPTPEPSVVDYLVTHALLGAGVNLVTTLEGQLAAARAALPGLVEDHKVNMNARAFYVQTETNGDPAQIPISGFAVAGTPGTPIGPLPRPENVKAVMGPFPGMIKLSCDPVKGTQMYVMDCRLIDPPGGAFQQAKLSTKSRNDLTGLVSGKMYAFRMAVIGAAGQSPWSDEAQCMAP